MRMKLLFNWIASTANHAMQAREICRADQLDVDLIADVRWRELIDQRGEAAQRVTTKIYRRQPYQDSPPRALGKNFFGIAYRFTFLPRKQQGTFAGKRRI